MYTDTAPPECHDNSTEGVQIFVILAKRIKTANNQTITNQELIDFGDKLAAEFGLTEQLCKNYLLLIGVENAKTAYTRTGKDLKLPEDLMDRIYNQSENVFKEKNYMEGLNKMIDEIGEQMIDPFKNEQSEIEVEELNSTTAESIVEEVTNTTIDEVIIEASTKSTEEVKLMVTPWWMFALMTVTIIMTIVALTLLGINKLNTLKRMQMQTVIHRSPTIKSNCPSEDSDSGRFATITILRELGMDDESTFSHVHEESREVQIVDESKPNTPSEDFIHKSEVVEEDQLEIRSESKTPEKIEHSNVRLLKSKVHKSQFQEDKEEESPSENSDQSCLDQISNEVNISQLSPSGCESLNSTCTQSSTNEKQNDYNENVISAF